MAGFYRWQAAHTTDERIAGQLGMKAAQLLTGARVEEEFLAQFREYIRSGWAPEELEETETIVGNPDTETNA